MEELGPELTQAEEATFLLNQFLEKKPWVNNARSPSTEYRFRTEYGDNQGMFQGYQIRQAGSEELPECYAMWTPEDPMDSPRQTRWFPTQEGSSDTIKQMIDVLEDLTKGDNEAS